MLSKIGNIIHWIIVASLIAVSGMLILSTFSNPLGLRVFSITSGSMEPNIPFGSLVFTKVLNDYNVGDAVTFSDRRNEQDTTTHRIVEKSEDIDRGVSTYITKGDANEDPDIIPVTSSQIIGKVYFVIPLIGHVVNLAKTQFGFTFLIVIPATLLAFSELNNIKKEVLSFINERNLKKVPIITQPPVNLQEEFAQNTPVQTKTTSMKKIRKSKTKNV